MPQNRCCYLGVAINNVHHQGPRKNGPGLRAELMSPPSCQSSE